MKGEHITEHEAAKGEINNGFDPSSRSRRAGCLPSFRNRKAIRKKEVVTIQY
jgi:hypothetical protein